MWCGEMQEKRLGLKSYGLKAREHAMVGRCWHVGGCSTGKESSAPCATIDCTENQLRYLPMLIKETSNRHLGFCNVWYPRCADVLLPTSSPASVGPLHELHAPLAVDSWTEAHGAGSKALSAAGCDGLIGGPMTGPRSGAKACCSW